MENITKFITCKLKLKANQFKSKVDRAWRRKFLGVRIGRIAYSLTTRTAVVRSHMPNGLTAKAHKDIPTDALNLAHSSSD